MDFWKTKTLSFRVFIFIFSPAYFHITEHEMNAAEKKRRKTLLEIESLDEYDPTVVEGYLTRFLVEHFFCSSGNEPETHDITRVVDKANGALAHLSLDAVTADKVRSALAPLVEIGRTYLPRDRPDEFFVVPRATRDERFEIQSSAEWDFLAVCDELGLDSEARDHESNVREVEEFKNCRDSRGRARYAVVGYPREGVDTYDNARYPLADQGCRIRAVL